MFPLQVLEEIDDLGLDGHIQGSDGLVRHQQLRPHTQRPGNGNPLPLSAGQLPGTPVQRAWVHSHTLELEGGLLTQGASGWTDVVDGHRFSDDIRHLHSRIEAGSGILKNQLPGGLQKLPMGTELPRVTDVDAKITDFSGSRPDKAHDAPRHRGLSGSGFTHQSENFSPAQLEGDMIHCPDDGISPQPEAVGQLLHIQQNLTHTKHLSKAV